MDSVYQKTNRQKTIRLISICLAMMLFFNLVDFAVFAIEDTSGPAIESIIVNNTEARVGGTITYSIQVSDQTEFSQGYMLLKNGESITGLGLTLQPDGSLIATKNVNNSSTNGSYEIYSITLSDTLGNNSMYSQPQLYVINPNLTVTISGSAEGPIGPVIKSITVDKTEATVGEKITYTVEATDEAGISWASIYLSFEENNLPVDLVLQEDGTYKGTLTINNSFQNGTYNVAYIKMNDASGVQHTFTSEEIAVINPNLNFNVTGSIGDTNPPIIESIEVDKSEATLGDQVIYTVIVNEQSELATAWMTLSCGSNTKEISLLQQPDGTYKGILKIDGTFLSGTYDVDYISLDDIYWNHSYYPVEVLESINPDLSFLVTGGTGDTTGPIINTIIVDKSEATVGDAITYIVQAIDENGFSYGNIQLSNGSSCKDVFLEPQEDGSIMGSLSVDNSFLNGTYEIYSVFLIDTLENQSIYTAVEIAELDGNQSFTVTGSSEDGKIPGLASIEVSGSPVTDGGEINIDFDWTGEPFHGISLNFLNFESNGNLYMWIDDTHIDDNGHVHYTQPINEYLASGQYSLESVYVHYFMSETVDRAEGNVYDCSIVVNNLKQDIIAPELLTESIIISQTAEELIIDMNCLETGSGLQLASFSFSNQNGDYLDIQGNFNDNTLVVSENGYRITEDILDIVPSEYILESAYLLDAANNYHFYENSQLPLRFFSIIAEDRRVVTFDIQNGNDLKLKPVYVNTPISKPLPPLQEGYNFAGWYVDAECTVLWDFNIDVVSDITLYAKWVENTPVGSGIEVTDVTETVNLVFDTVTSGGKTIVEPLTEPDDESFFHIEGSGGFFDIKTTAEFNDSVKITVKYDPALLEKSQVESELRLYQFKDGIPIDITDPLTPVDTLNKTITGIITDHFCVFSVGIPQNNEVNVTYTGSTLTPASLQKVLSSQVTPVNPEDDLEYANIYIEFSIKGTDGTVRTLQPVQCNENGVASVQVDLETDVYSVEARILENGYAAPANDNAIVVVYDPTGGFVTGGGWINSPVGAYMADQTTVGKANFGFSSKYQKGAVVPTGNTEFQFKLGALNFHSDSYDWLVVNKESKRAQYKGTGTINGSGQYKFMIWATDNLKGSDTFRIKIWNALNEDEVIYDNGSEQVIGGGQIAVIVK